ncbi:MAG TPA: glycerophosphodiester phosphodiesterase family protein [Pirellulales bacterium]|jgi:glycerophosphoryl diester phosphodiesterase
MTTLTPVAALLRKNRVLVVAHRGASRVAPENTLLAFEAALQVGVDLVEFDYLHSADGVPVAFHDEELDRLTDAHAVFGEAKIRLATKTLAELKRLDAGGWFGPQFVGTRIPTLAEALDTILTGAMPLVERKAGDAATFVELIRQKNCLGRLAVIAFDWDFLADCRRLAPDLTLGAIGQHDLTAAQLDEIQSFGAAFVGWNNDHLTKPYIDAIHERGLKASVWTVDDAERARQLIDFGIDAITSNVPEKIKAVVAAHPRAR